MGWKSILSFMKGERSRTMCDMLAIGSEAPDFALVSDSGDVVRLSNHRGKENVVLVFYPKNNTPG
jgi:peroxiredoxin